MGYQILFKTKNLPQEIFEEYRSNYSGLYSNGKLDEFINTARIELITELCNLDKNILKEGSVNISGLIFKLNSYKNLLEGKWKAEFCDRLKNDEEIWYCGWDYSTPHRDTININDIIENVIVYAFSTKEVDAIKDDEYFSNKYNEISDKLIAIDECIDDFLSHQFVDKYRDYQDKDDDDDIDSDSDSDNESVE